MITAIAPQIRTNYSLTQCGIAAIKRSSTPCPVHSGFTWGCPSQPGNATQPSLSLSLHLPTTKGLIKSKPQQTHVRLCPFSPRVGSAVASGRDSKSSPYGLPFLAGDPGTNSYIDDDDDRENNSAVAFRIIIQMIWFNSNLFSTCPSSCTHLFPAGGTC